MKELNKPISINELELFDIISVGSLNDTHLLVVRVNRDRIYMVENINQPNSDVRIIFFKVKDLRSRAIYYHGTMQNSKKANEVSIKEFDNGEVRFNRFGKWKRWI